MVHNNKNEKKTTQRLQSKNKHNNKKQTHIIVQ